MIAANHCGFTYDVLNRSKADDTILDALRGVKNRVPREGLNDMATAYFKQGAGPAALYIGLWSGSHTPDGEETAANLLTKVTEVTQYNQSGRLLLQLGAVADGALSNILNLARFDMNDTGNLNGMFLSTVQAKGATTGKILSVVRFPNQRNFDPSTYFEVMAGFQFTSLSL